MKELFGADNIILGYQAADKWQVIEACGNLLVDLGYVEAQYVEDMKERERSVSVYVGNQLAIPHGVAGSEQYIKESGLVLLQIPNGVDFDGETCKIMIGIAGKDGSHIELLGKISLVCLDMDNINRMIEAKDKETILEILSLV